MRRTTRTTSPAPSPAPFSALKAYKSPSPSPKSPKSPKKPSPSPVELQKTSVGRKTTAHGEGMGEQGMNTLNGNGKGGVTAFISLAAYVLASFVMTSVNKAVAVMKFPGPNALLLAESAVTAILLGATHALGKIQLQSFSEGVMKHLPVVTLAKAGNMYFSFLTMAHTSLPVYNVLKRLNPVFSLLIDYGVRSNRPSIGMLLGVLLISLGAVVTSQGDLEFELFGYVVAILAAVCQALYLVLAKNASDQMELSHWDLLFFTAIFNSVIFVPFTAFEVRPLLDFWAGTNETVNVLFMLSGYICLGALLNYVTFWATSLNNPTSVGVAGNVKGVLSTITGLIMGAKLTTVGFLGLFLSASGALTYTLSVYITKKLDGWKAENKKKA
jgi:drug/metabolite transporter (DMT)-like permease